MTADLERIRQLVENLFRPAAPPRADGSIGAELELIPVRESSLKRVPIATTDEGPGSAELVRDAARAETWMESVDAYGAPSWSMPDGGRITYEPGGQLEITSPVFPSHEPLERFLRDTVSVLRDTGKGAGLLLLATGVDPYNHLEQVPLELHAPRYEAMTHYFNNIGPSGARMMRQTASLQVSVELGDDPMKRWALLNALAPYLLAAYANSPEYASAPTGYASYRAWLWQTLDASRTGLPFNRIDPVGGYTRFATSAGRILSGDEAHLTTLFPEVRPRGYFEIRCMDSMDADRAGEALRFLSALIHDSDVAEEVGRLIGDPDPALLERAAKRGRSDPAIGATLDALERLAASSGGIS